MHRALSRSREHRIARRLGIGRLRDGVGIPAAKAEMEAIFSRIAEENPESNRGFRANVLSLRSVASS